LRRRRSDDQEQTIVLFHAGNGWIVRLPEEEGAPRGECELPICPQASRERKTLVFRYRDHEAMIDVIDKACRRARERRKEPQ
jgi:hypothetical protein